MHASQKGDVRDILDCDYKVIAQITGTAVLPDEKCLQVRLKYTYLLLAEFSVRTVNYGPSFFPSISRLGHKSMEKNEDP